MTLDNINPDQIKRAFAKIKDENNFLIRRIETLEHTNKKILTRLEDLEENQKNNTNSNSNEKVPLKLIGNLLSGKIHIPTCPYAKKIAIQNREEYDDIKLALRNKYIKCSCINNFY